MPFDAEGWGSYTKTSSFCMLMQGPMLPITLLLVMTLKLGVTDCPTYSPNLTPCDFHLFETLTKNLGHKKFQKETDIKLPVICWRQTLDNDLF
jgi:hypothetical protein